MPETRPKGATHYYQHVFYKIGVHGFVFRWSETSLDWISSHKRVDEILKGRKVTPITTKRPRP